MQIDGDIWKVFQMMFTSIYQLTRAKNLQLLSVSLLPHIMTEQMNGEQKCLVELLHAKGCYNQVFPSLFEQGPWARQAGL